MFLMPFTRSISNDTDASNKPDVTGVHLQHLARGQVVLDDLTVELDPRRARARHALQDEALAAEEARAELLLEADLERDARQPAQVTAAVHHVLAACRRARAA